MSALTKQERGELARLVRRREKLAKAEAERVGAERMAKFAREVAANYHVGDDEVWREAYLAATAAVNEANERICERCRELGIQDEFAPTISPPHWYSRGENAAIGRAAELRRIATARIQGDVKAAKVEIEHRSLEVQEELVKGGLTTDEARDYLNRMPLVSELISPLSVADIESAENRRRPELG